jgi:hypothetical protein
MKHGIWALLLLIGCGGAAPTTVDTPTGTNPVMTDDGGEDGGANTDSGMTFSPTVDAGTPPVERDAEAAEATTGPPLCTASCTPDTTATVQCDGTCMGNCRGLCYPSGGSNSMGSTGLCAGTCKGTCDAACRGSLVPCNGICYP